jgi:hypothetical protein
VKKPLEQVDTHRLLPLVSKVFPINIPAEQRETHVYVVTEEVPIDVLAFTHMPVGQVLRQYI